MTRAKLALSAVVAFALVGLAVALPAAAVTDSTTNVQTQANATPGADFDQDIYDVQQGSVVAIDVSLNNTDTAVVVVGGQEKPYLLRATVTDGNGDDLVQLQFDTAEAGSTGGVISTFHDDDSVTVEKLSAPDSEFVGAYGMNVSANGTQVDTAAMAVAAQETTTTTTTTTSTSTTTSTTTASMDPTDTTESDGQPGFGIAVALVAIVAAAAAATRR